MTADINDDSIEVLSKMLMDAIQVNPDAQPVVMSLIETRMDNHVRQEPWGTILFRVWQELKEKASPEDIHGFSPDPPLTAERTELMLTSSFRTSG